MKEDEITLMATCGRCMQFSSAVAFGSHPKESLSGLPGIPGSVRPSETQWTTFEEPKFV